ncbi:MAG: DUF1553 domain-containing protein [Pirellulales bacterium]
MRRCIECHSGVEPKAELDLTSRERALKGGESGAALVAGQPDDSLLWQRIAADEMPPKHPLEDGDKNLLREWIAAGAAWGDTIDPLKFTTDARAGYDWWALRPVSRPELPAIHQGDWPVNAIDYFVLAELESHDLSPSPPAGRRELIRRVTFDLLGLPPTPEEAAAFMADESPRAYDDLIDRLLASPHYGERWARHWLDIIRFGESQGFERDKLRPNAWPYRDWLVAALNDDMPYDEFTRLQLAGDALRPDDPLAVTATGFLVAGAWDETGHTQQSLAMRAVVREDELEDFAAVVGQSFLGLTVNCARCHDHKFDPISQREYYQFTAALSGVRHGERDRLSEAGRPQALAQAGEIETDLAELTDRQQQLAAPLREEMAARRRAGLSPVEPPHPLARWDFDSDLRDSVGGLHGTAHGTARIENGRLRLDGGESFVATAPLAVPLRAKTLEVWAALADLDQQGGGAISLQTMDGNTFDAIVFGERDKGQWMAGSNGFVRTQGFQAAVETQSSPELVQFIIVYAEDGTITGYRNGQPYGQPYKSAGLQPFEAGKSQIVFGLRHGPPGGNKMLRGEIDRAMLYDRALSPEEVAAAAGLISDFVSDEELIAEMPADTRAQYVELAQRISLLAARRTLLTGGPTYLNKPSQPEVRHLLARGNPAAPGEIVSPAGIASLSGLEGDFGLSPDAPEADRRIKLAEWITDPANPLASRVIANRLWQYHFGQGLVQTPNDFGFNGGRPSHPALLDWLASELIRQEWSLKGLHRTILLSAAYRQSSRPRAEALRLDADNRLLWRHSPSRLDAESIRDAALSIAGELNPTLGGPGYQDFRTFIFNSQFYEPADPIGWRFNRRSLYRTMARSGTNPLLDVFDCPDPSTTAPKRAVTTTPLQALSLLNDSFMLRMAGHLAQRVEREAGDNVEEQITRIYLLAYSRPPQADEIALAQAFIPQHGLPAFCRVIFNSNGFLFVD